MAGQKTIALILGIILALLGLGGLLLSNPLGVGMNTIHSILLLVGGLIGIYVGIKKEGPTYNKVIGILALITGILGFIPGVSGLMESLLGTNTMTYIVHIVIGIVALLVGKFMKGDSAPAAEAPPTEAPPVEPPKE
tara:strand:- start:4547 stop:4954 length:408 start_codon:yes stop_codon:yes gene_type:complete